MTYTTPLRDPESARKAFTAAWVHAKPLLLDGKQLIMEIKPTTRSSLQNRYLHAMLGDIAKQIEWAGAKRDVDTWKRLMIGAWCRARHEHIEMLPAIDGHGVEIVFRRSSQLTRAECVELCEFIGAWCAHNGVTLRDARAWVDPETGECSAPL